MNPSTELVGLHRVFSYKLRKIQAAGIAASKSPGDQKSVNQCMGFATIELLNLWNNFVRAYLFSLPLRPKRRSGLRALLYDQSIVTPAQLIATLTIALKGVSAAVPTTRRDEPKWYERTILVRSIMALKPSNRDQVLGAISLSNGAIDNLPCFRNYFAHRNDQTAEKATRLAFSKYMISGKRHPADVLVSSAQGRPQELILDFCDEIGAIADLMCE